MEKKAAARVVFFPIPAVGHLKSTVEMAKQLLLHHPFSITVLIMNPYSPSYTPSPHLSTYIDSLASSTGPESKIHFQPLPPLDPPLTFQRDHQKIETFISLVMIRHKPLVKDAITKLLLSPSSSSSSPFPVLPIAGLVMDFFATAMIDVANELGIPPYIYFASDASMLGLMLYLPTLHVKVPSEFEDLQGDLDVPGLPHPLPPLSMPTPVMSKKDQAYTWFVHHGRRFREASGIIVNTFAELEPAAIRGLAEGDFLPDHRPTPPVYPVGPLLALESKAGPEHECIQWLNGQPTGSVVFLCFGNMGSFLPGQVKEMALGLERSGHRFLWSLRTPAPPGGASRYPTDANLDQVLPEGFLERTKGMGMVWPSWAPQAEVLAHPATGGFITHCGWNSCLESLWFGVPMLAWPLYAEQHFNAFEMVWDLGVAVELKVDRKGGNFVGAEELEKGVRCLMEEDCCEQGKKVRAKAKEMKEASRKAVVEGGSSFASLERLAEELIKGVSTISLELSNRLLNPDPTLNFT